MNNRDDEMTSVDQNKDLICRAIAERRILQFKYDGRLRIVEPFAFGKGAASAAASAARRAKSATDDDDECGGGGYVLRGFQIRGSDKTKPLCWRLYDLAGISQISVTKYDFAGKRSEYDPDALDMAEVCCRIS